MPPSRGDIWWAQLGPVVGHEQDGDRPVLIVSEDILNHGVSTLIIVIPLTRTWRNLPHHVAIDPQESGLRERSYALCEAVRSISKQRLRGVRLGVASASVMSRIEDYLALLLGL